MSITKIQLKYGTGHPGTVLDIAEPAVDIDSSTLYIGTGYGYQPMIFYGVDASGYVSIDPSIADLYTITDNLDASIITNINDIISLDSSIQNINTELLRLDSSISINTSNILNNTNELVSVDASIQLINTELLRLDSSIIEIKDELFSLDSSIQNINTELIRLDASISINASNILNNTSDISINTNHLVSVDASIVLLTPTYIITSSEYDLGAPSGDLTNHIIKNIGTIDISINCGSGYQIDNEDYWILPSMSTMHLLNYDVSNWYII